MVFNPDVLFVHVPKAGGMSVSVYLLRVLPRPVWLRFPSDALRRAMPEGARWMAGLGHETLAEAREVLDAQGLDLGRLSLLLAVMRNPYDLEASRYTYLRAGAAWYASRNRDLAVARDFEAFAVHSEHHAGPSRPVESYFVLDGAIPANLRVVRFEDLAAGVATALREAGIRTTGAFPWLNRTPPGHGRVEYTEAAEAAVHRRYRWVFDGGYYPRLTAEQLNRASRASRGETAGGRA
jgi:hypothetical protein